jgi:hypothetical protein
MNYRDEITLSLQRCENWKDGDDVALLHAEKPVLFQSLAAAWRDSPHVAMELLESVVLKFPFPFPGDRVRVLADLVREVVTLWKANGNYSWQAGGGADHCYLTALLLSQNASLAEDALYSKNVSHVRGKVMKWIRDGVVRDFPVKYHNFSEATQARMDSQ